MPYAELIARDQTPFWTCGYLVLLQSPGPSVSVFPSTENKQESYGMCLVFIHRVLHIWQDRPHFGDHL